MLTQTASNSANARIEVRQDADSGFVPRCAETGFARLLLRPSFHTAREKIILAGFDRFDRLVHWREIASQEDQRCSVPASCWRSLAACGTLVHVIIAHNHPSDIARASGADIAFTRTAVTFLGALQVDLVDHLIFTTDGHFSFARAGLL